jgi:predicted nucleic-acid-binding Zn-ribbon protein
MRNSKRCPKCKSADIVRIPGEVGSYGAGNNISVGRTIFSNVKVTRFLCASCGFSEEWLESIDDIASIKKKYGALPPS